MSRDFHGEVTKGILWCQQNCMYLRTISTDSFLGGLSKQGKGFSSKKKVQSEWIDVVITKSFFRDWGNLEMTKSFDFTPVVVSSPQCLKHFTKKERREYLHMQYTLISIPTFISLKCKKPK